MPCLESEEDAFLYLILEHQSQVDREMPFRLWQYATHIMSENYNPKREKPLPLVVPMVLYHGKKHYRAPTCLTQLVDAPSMPIEDVLGHFQPFYLLNTHDIADDDIHGATAAHYMVYSLKSIFQKDFLPKIKATMPILRDALGQLGQHDAVKFFEALMNYLSREADISDKKDFIDVFEDGLRGQPEEKVFMTVYEQLRAETVEQMGSAWKQEGRQEVAEKMVAMGMALSDVVAATGMTVAEIDKIRR